MLFAFVSALGPLTGGLLADYFSKRSLDWNIQWDGANASHVIHLLQLQGYGFLFVIGALLAFWALRLVRKIKEDGEIEKDIAIGEMRVAVRQRLRETVKKEAVVSFLVSPVTYPIQLKKMIEKKIIIMRRLRRLNKVA